MAAKNLVVTFADETTATVRPNLADTLNFETTLRKKPHWGTLQENLLKAGPFRAWSALRRTGQTTMTWEEFSTGDTAVLDVSEEDADTAEDAELDFLGSPGLKTAADS